MAEIDEHSNNAASPKRYPVLDLVRFVAAIMVILLHIFPEGTTPEMIGIDDSVPMLLGQSFVDAILRTAVPVFFIISGFLLFKRIEEDKEHKWKHIGRYCLRLLLLYLFWYVAGLPLVVRDIVDFIQQGDSHGLVRYIIITLWKGAPRGYWFLVSLALSVTLVGLVQSRKAFIALTIIAGLLYAYGCFNAAYFGLFSLHDDPFSKVFYTIGDYLELAYCPLQALLYVALGKVFALHGPLKTKGIVVLPMLFLLMAGELFLARFIHVLVYSDAYFTLPLFVFAFMNLILHFDSGNKRFIDVAKKLKDIGSFSYLFHLQFFCYAYWIFGTEPLLANYWLIAALFLLCVGASFFLQTLFERLSKKRGLGFLRYSY